MDTQWGNNEERVGEVYPMVRPSLLSIKNKASSTILDLLTNSIIPLLSWVFWGYWVLVHWKNKAIFVKFKASVEDVDSKTQKGSLERCFNERNQVVHWKQSWVSQLLLSQVLPLFSGLWTPPGACHLLMHTTVSRFVSVPPDFPSLSFLQRSVIRCHSAQL